MKFFKRNRSLFVLMISFITVFAMTDISHARDSRGLSKDSSVEILQNTGEFGLGRISVEKLGSRAISKSSKLKKGVIPDVNPTAIVYAAYSSYTDEFDNNTYWAWVNQDSAYLFVAFRVTGKTKVKVNWEIEGPDGEYEYDEVIEDSEEAGGLLNPDYWYFAWWKPEDSLNEGLYDYLATVKPFPAGKRGKDSCQFEVVGD